MNNNWIADVQRARFKPYSRKPADRGAPSLHWAQRTELGSDDFANMRNNGMTAGLDSGTPAGSNQASQRTRGILWVLDVAGVPDWFIDRTMSVGIGNPIMSTERGRQITETDLHAVFGGWRLYRYGAPHKHVIEIGGGFGALAGVLCKAWDDIERYTLVDLPDSLALQRYYLGQMFGDLSRFDFRECAIGDAPGELVINIRSMMEMSHGQVVEYFDEIKARKPWFYCVNRYAKLTELRLYPFGDKWRPHISQPLIGQRHIHEYLLQWDERGNFEDQLRTLPSAPETGIPTPTEAPDVFNC